MLNLAAISVNRLRLRCYLDIAVNRHPRLQSEFRPKAIKERVICVSLGGETVGDIQKWKKMQKYPGDARGTRPKLAFDHTSIYLDGTRSGCIELLEVHQLAAASSENREPCFQASSNTSEFRMMRSFS